MLQCSSAKIRKLFCYFWVLRVGVTLHQGCFPSTTFQGHSWCPWRIRTGITLGFFSCIKCILTVAKAVKACQDLRAHPQRAWKEFLLLCLAEEHKGSGCSTQGCRLCAGISSHMPALQSQPELQSLPQQPQRSGSAALPNYSPAWTRADTSTGAKAQKLLSFSFSFHHCCLGDSGWFLVFKYNFSRLTRIVKPPRRGQAEHKGSCTPSLNF